MTQISDVTATNIKAIRRSKALAINPISTGPTRNAAIPKVFIVAKPAPGGRPGTLAAAAKSIGDATETPKPVNINPGNDIQGFIDKIMMISPAVTRTPPVINTFICPCFAISESPRNLPPAMKKAYSPKPHPIIVSGAAVISLR